MSGAKARWWHEEGGRLRCDLCPHRCILPDGGIGRCGARQNVKGTLISRTYGQVCVRAVDQIEKKPMFHYRPGTKLLSLGTFGCNLSCAYCQNAPLATSSGEGLEPRRMEPREIVDLALKEGVQGIAWTFNEPTVWAELIMDTAALARENGLYTMINTNGYMLPEAARDIVRSVDALNIDVKGFSEQFYEKVCGGSLREVLDTCLLARREGKHVELTYLLVPGLNDSEAEVRRFSKWAAEEMGPDTPVFFFRFQPSHRLADLPEQSMEVMERSARIAREAGLRFVYLGGVAGVELDTRCPSCGEVLVKRRSVRPPQKVCLKGSEVSRFCPSYEVTVIATSTQCPRCGARVPLVLGGAPEKL